MTGQIPEEFINDLRHRADIVTIISEFVPLKKQGRNYTGVCPFHSEKTPSFVVSPEKQIFHCFGCGKGGNVFSFLMEKNAMTFIEAVEFIAKRLGIILPQSSISPEKAKQDSLKKRYYHINEITAKFYQQLLFEETSREALRYLQDRGLQRTTLEKFVLGYVPDDWSRLTSYLLNQDVAEQELLILGLAVKTQKGNLIDRFRNRIIYPIMDEAGRIIGFGGRVLNDAQPKYLNSPDTPLFSKGKHLYGLYLAKSSIREQDRAIIMEGYMDVITSWQNGFTNVVGTLGTALTPDQVRLLMRYSYNTFICFDSDSAGEKAALRGLDILQDIGCNVSVVSIPGSKDPDDFIRKEGRARFTEIVERAHNLLEYKLIKLMEQYNTQTVSGRIKVVQELIPDILKTKSPIARQASVQMIGERLAFPENAIHAEIRKALSDQKPLVHNIERARSLSAGEKAQRILIRLTVENPDLIEKVEEMGGKELFNNVLLKEIYQSHYVIRQSGHNIKANDLISLLEDRKAQEILAEILLENEFPEDLKRIYQDCLILLRIELLQQHINDKNSKMSELEKKGEVTKALELMSNIQKLVKEKHDLTTSLRKGGSNIEN